MRITPDTTPAHIARAYGIAPRAPAIPAAPIDAPDFAHRNDVVDFRADARPEPGAELIAAQVNRPVDFAPGAPTASAPGAIAFYRHPADRNAVATSIEAGRVIDVSG
jgi:hypothetical protein